MLEEALRKAVDPLEEARLIAGEALSIPELPLYIGQNFMNLIGKIDDSAGGGSLRYFHALRRIQNFFEKNTPMEYSETKIKFYIEVLPISG
jgi:hypothetical protein